MSLGEKKWPPHHDLRNTIHKAFESFSFILSAHDHDLEKKPFTKLLKFFFSCFCPFRRERVGFEWYAMQYALVGPWIHRKRLTVAEDNDEIDRIASMA